MLKGNDFDMAPHLLNFDRKFDHKVNNFIKNLLLSSSTIKADTQQRSGGGYVGGDGKLNPTSVTQKGLAPLRRIRTPNGGKNCKKIDTQLYPNRAVKQLKILFLKN